MFPAAVLQRIIFPINKKVGILEFIFVVNLRLERYGSFQLISKFATVELLAFLRKQRFNVISLEQKASLKLHVSFQSPLGK